jgi:apolipoprotein N-acyltransferase
VQPAAEVKLEKSEQEIAGDLLELQKLTREVAADGRTDLVLWPEQVTPWAVNDDFSMRTWVEAGSAAIDRPILFGALWYEDGAYYNAMTFVTPKSGLAYSSYAKRRLVPFGEYIPFADLGWTRSLTPVVDSFTAGKSETILKVAGIKFFPLICYEDTFSGLADGARESADAIVVATNDGWFGHEGAQAQHVSHDVLRAIEQGIPVVRVANDGLSGVVDPLGEFHSINNNSFGSVAQQALLNCDRAWSGFAHHPDLWRWSFPVAMIFLGALGRAVRQPRKPRR